MSQKMDKPTRAIGLDIGTSHVVVARAGQEGESESYQSELNAFVAIPYRRMTELALEKEGIPYQRVDGQLRVYGRASERFASLLALETRRPMRGGLLNPHEPANVEAIGKLLDTLLGPQASPDTLACYGVPGPPLTGEAPIAYHEATIANLLTEKGFRPKSVDEGLAVIYGELEDTNYSGVGISCGGGLCNVTLAFLAVPIVSFSIPKAGDYIDASAAASIGEPVTRIRLEKEQRFSLNGAPKDPRHQALAVYYQEVIDELIGAMTAAFAESRAARALDGPVPIVLSGGTALPKGFRERFEQALKAANFPIRVSEVRLARQPLYSTARGLLRAALAEMDG